MAAIRASEARSSRGGPAARRRVVPEPGGSTDPRATRLVPTYAMATRAAARTRIGLLGSRLMALRAVRRSTTMATSNFIFRAAAPIRRFVGPRGPAALKVATTRAAMVADATTAVPDGRDASARGLVASSPRAFRIARTDSAVLPRSAGRPEPTKADAATPFRDPPVPCRSSAPNNAPGRPSAEGASSLVPTTGTSGTCRRARTTTARQVADALPSFYGMAGTASASAGPSALGRAAAVANPDPCRASKGGVAGATPVVLLGGTTIVATSRRRKGHGTTRASLRRRRPGGYAADHRLAAVGRDPARVGAAASVALAPIATTTTGGAAAVATLHNATRIALTTTGKARVLGSLGSGHTVVGAGEPFVV